MPLPGGLSTFTISLGPYLDLEGNVTFGGVQGKLSVSPPIVDATSGALIFKSVDFYIDNDGTATVGPLVHNDDPNINQGTQYTLEWQIRSSLSSPGNKTFVVPIASGSTVDYDLLTSTTGTATGPYALPLVTSVAGRSGAVTLAKADVGLGSVDNTADTAKPVSTAQATALAAKANIADVGLPVAATVTTAGALVGQKHNPADATSGALTMTLPTGASAGTMLGAEKVDSTTNAVTVSGNMRGSAGQSIPLTTAHEVRVFVADAAGSWWPIADHRTTASLDAAYSRVFTPEAYGAKGDGSTDDTAAFTAALAAIYAAGGGTLALQAKTYRCNGQITPPTDGASTYPRGVSMRWVGAGAYTDPVGSSGPYPSQVGAGGTFLDLRYSGGGSNLPKIDCRGKGLLEITGITFTDLGTSSNPFLQTTNTTLHVHDCAFAGNPSKSGVTCDQDAIVLGGTTTVTGGNAVDAPFQGYGTVIAGNYFARIRRAVFGQVFCNGSVIRDNNIWISCGTNLVGGAAIELNSGAVGGTSLFGNTVAGNLIEIAHYPYGILLDYAQGTLLLGNNFYDPANGVSLACIRFASTNAKFNTAVLGFGSISGAWSGGVHISEQTGGLNTWIDPLSSGGSQSVAIPTYARGLKTAATFNVGAGTPEAVFGGAANSAGVYTGGGAPEGSIVAPTGSLYLRTSGDYGITLYVKEANDTTNLGWIPFGPTAAQPTVTKTTSYTAANIDRVIIANGAAVTVTLPAAAASNLGKTYTVKNINSASASVAVAASGTIDGSASAVSLAQWAKGTFLSDGTQWLTV